MRKAIVFAMMLFGFAYAEINTVDPRNFESMGAYSAFLASTESEMESLIGDYELEFLSIYPSNVDVSEYGYCVIYVEPGEIAGTMYYGFVLDKKSGEAIIRFYGLRKS